MREHISAQYVTRDLIVGLVGKRQKNGLLSVELVSAGPDGTTWSHKAWQASSPGLTHDLVADMVTALCEDAEARLLTRWGIAASLPGVG